MPGAAPALNVDRLRADVPALTNGVAHFDGPGGTQTPRPVIDAIAAALTAPLANRGHDNEAERNAEQIVTEARLAMSDLTGVDPTGVVFGRSATQLIFDLARTLARDWGPGDEVIVTRLDHDANIRPWVIVSEASGAQVRWADFDTETAELEVEHISRLLSPRTRLVAVTGASNLIGTRPELSMIARQVHDCGALLWVDAVHLAAHALLDLDGLGADFAVCSPYKFLGPHHGVLIASPERLAGLQPDKLLPSSNAVPERFELGTLPYEVLAGTTAAVNYLAGLVETEGSRRARLGAGYAALHEHEEILRDRLESGLAELGATIYSRARTRTSTILFDLPGHDAASVARHLAADGVNAPAGSFYAIETSRHLGLGDHGAVRAGLAPYSNREDVDRLLNSLHRIHRSSASL